MCYQYIVVHIYILYILAAVFKFVCLLLFLLFILLFIIVKMTELWKYGMSKTRFLHIIKFQKSC